MAALQISASIFLTLLTTQLQNQDPLEPMDSSEFTNQLVQFSQVEQQIRTNSQLEDLVTLQDLSLTSIALGYIGMNVEIEGDTFDYASGNYEFAYNIPAGGSTDTTIKIYDEDGQLVRSYQGDIAQGKHKIVWDGKDDFGNDVNAGKYNIEVVALDGEGEPLQNVKTHITVMVDGVETVDGQLVLTGGDLYIPYSAIYAASIPGAPTNPTTGDSGTETTTDNNETNETNQNDA